MPKSVTVTKNSAVIQNNQICPFCSNAFVSGQVVVVCPLDQAVHHQICWIQNGNKCAVFGCIGGGSVEPEQDANDSYTIRLKRPIGSRVKIVDFSRSDEDGGASDDVPEKKLAKQSDFLVLGISFLIGGLIGYILGSNSVGTLSFVILSLRTAYSLIGSIIGLFSSCIMLYGLQKLIKARDTHMNLE